MSVERNPLRLRFRPVRIDPLGGPGCAHLCDEVTIYPDRLEIGDADAKGVVVFRDIAQLTGGRPHVADRDWFHPEGEKFFRFFTTPPLTIVLPPEPPETPYGGHLFRRIQEVLSSGGFATFDLG